MILAVRFLPKPKLEAVSPKTKRPETFVSGLSITVYPQLPEPRIHPSGLLLRLRVSPFPRLPTVPAMVLRVSPRLPSFSGPLQQAPRFPRPLTVPVPPFRRLFGSPRIRHLPAMLRAQLSGLRVFPFPGRPEIPIPAPSAAPAADPPSFQVSPVLRLSHLPALPATQLRVSPMPFVLRLCQRQVSRFP